jgi:hypothetical protein
MAITPLPPVPLRSDAPATFVTKADAFLGALNLFATEVDAVGVALTLVATNATSTTSLLIGLGSKSLTVQTGKSYVVGMTVKIASTATGVDWMLGDITSCTTGTGDLVVTVVGISGSGTFADWSISQSATGGAKLGANADITSLSGLTTPLSVAQGGSGSNAAATGTGRIVLAMSPTLTGSPVAPTAAVNTSTTQLATTAFANPASSLSANGYVKLSSGVILQWGAVTGASPVVTFPIAFPSALGTAMAMPNNASTSAPVPYISARSTTGFTVTFAGTSTNWFWFAIGY